MQNLLEIREKIDEIDEKILQLFEERMDCSQEVVKIKIQTGKKVFDTKREEEKLAVLAQKADDPFLKQGVTELFSQIMAISRKMQYQCMTDNPLEEAFIQVDNLDKERARVVFQGVEGAYSFAAMRSFFEHPKYSFSVETWKAAMEAIATGEADYAVLPIENSTAGIVQDIYDLLVEYDHFIVGEQIIPCDHVLLGIPGSKLKDITTVYSHPQALLQCKDFLETQPGWNQVELTNTALSAKKVMIEADKTKAAIASHYAGEFYGLEVLKEHIATNDCNSTRFIIVSKEKKYSKKANKVSVCFELPHLSGSLYSCLSHFIYNHLSMTKIESRPIYHRNWEYRFFVDFEGNLKDSAVQSAIRGLKAEVSAFRILGNYEGENK